MSSSRRATGEINILAMLDGQAPGRRFLARPAVVWYGAAGLLACSLLVALAWLVRGATPAHGAATTTAITAATPTTGTAQASTQPAQSALPAPDAYTFPAVTTPARGAVIIDLPQPVAAVAAADMAVHTPAGTATTRPQSAAPRHPVAHPAPPPVPSARPQPAYRTAPSQTLAHAEAVPARPKRGAASSRAAPPPATVDTDVALISAILLHTGARNEAADGAGTPACADKACGPRMPSRQ
jgi:hypothetical protein